jgi:6,7-dimethyl-8-ribityllumazine synthase
MIKSVHRLYVPRDEKQYSALVDLFEALGLARGESWKGRRSLGIKFEAPSSGVEIGMGAGFPDADLVIEVDSVDAAHAAAKRREFDVIGDVQSCDWGARLFTIALPNDAGRVAIFSYETNWRESEPGAGKLDARDKRFAIVVSRFNAFITERLLAGAMDGLLRMGAKRDDIRVVWVPGAFEIPATARALAKTRKYAAVLCLGCLLRGETLHYEVIANEVARGIGQAGEDTGVPHIFGVLTCDTLEQAIDRAGLKGGNKGYEAALAAVEMANLEVRAATSKTKKAAPRRAGARTRARGKR